MRRLFLLAQSLSAFALVWLSATATEKVVVLLFGWVAGGVIAVLTLTWLHFAGARGQRSWSAVVGAAVTLAIVVTVIATAWPLRLSYALSRPALQRLAGDVQAGRLPNGEVRVGLFVIRQAQVSRKSIVCLWTDLNPTGRTGFVRCGTDAFPGNLWSSIQLDKQWQLVAED